MIVELHIASNLLGVALERYCAAWSSITNTYDSGSKLKGIPQAISDIIPGELELIASYETKLKQVKAAIDQTRNVIPPVRCLAPYL